VTGGPAETHRPPSAGPVLLFDGDCPLCHAAVRFVLRHERRPRLFFAALSGPPARRLLADRPDLAGADTLMWVDRDEGGAPRRIELRSSAVLRVCGVLGGAWPLLRIAWLVPKPLRDAAYDLVARRRRRLSGAAPCPSRPPLAADRFLDR